MSIGSLAVIIGKLLAFAGIGVALRYAKVLRPEDSKSLNAVIIYAGVPALVFQAVHPAVLTWELALVAGIAWVVALAGFGLGWLASRMLKLTRPAAGAMMLTCALGNTGYIGYPVALSILGQTGLVRAVFYDVFGTVGVLLTVGVAVAASHGASEERPVLIREVLTFPAVIAVAAALVLRPVPVPIPVSQWLDAIAKMVVPLIMISLGLSFRPRSIGALAGQVSVVAGIKLIVLPFAALLVGRALLGADPAAVSLVVLQAGAPSMMLSLVFGERFQLDTELVAAAIVATTVSAIVTIPLMQTLAR